MLVNTGLGGVVFGHVIVLQPPGNFNTPVNNCMGSFTLTWSAVNGATSYILQRKILGGQWETIYTGPNLTFAQTNLAVGSYQYQLIAVKGTKQSEPVQTATVTVLQQGNVGNPYRSGNLLLQDVRNGCTTSPNQIGKYGCMDSTANNFDPTATINEGCTYDPPCTVIDPVAIYTLDIVGDPGCGATVTVVGDPVVAGKQAGDFVPDTVAPWTIQNSSNFGLVGTVQISGTYTYSISYYGVRHNILTVNIQGFTIGGCQ